MEVPPSRHNRIGIFFIGSADLLMLFWTVSLSILPPCHAHVYPSLLPRYAVQLDNISLLPLMHTSARAHLLNKSSSVNLISPSPVLVHLKPRHYPESRVFSFALINSSRCSWFYLLLREIVYTIHLLFAPSLTAQPPHKLSR
eukprot:GHVT01096698.1.p1 GENE.GHVT01096698.1~~GHVT01096698.1.p1  ORF type:complete len:142 (+),score=8.83 GHVT01096698.1:819-1244(+)